MRRVLLAATLLASVALAKEPYINKIKQEATPTATQQARLKGIDNIAECSKQKEDDLTIYHCLGQGKAPAYITVVQFKDNTKGAVFNYPPYQLGDGPDAFVLEQRQDNIDASYVLQLPTDFDSSDSQGLFSLLSFPKNRTQYFLAHHGCESLQGSPRIGLDNNNWLPTWIIRSALRHNSSLFDDLYQNKPLSRDELNRAYQYRMKAESKWDILKSKYCF